MRGWLCSLSFLFPLLSNTSSNPYSSLLFSMPLIPSCQLLPGAQPSLTSEPQTWIMHILPQQSSGERGFLQWCLSGPSTSSQHHILLPHHCLGGSPTLLSTSSYCKYLQWVQLKWSGWYQAFLNMRGGSLMTR